MLKCFLNTDVIGLALPTKIIAPVKGEFYEIPQNRIMKG